MIHDENDENDEMNCRILSSHHRALPVGSGGALSRSITWRIAIWIGLKDARRSRTAARSESSTSPSTHRPTIESSSSSTLLASSMMVHVDDDLVAM